MYSSIILVCVDGDRVYLLTSAFLKSQIQVISVCALRFLRILSWTSLFRCLPKPSIPETQ